MYVSVVFLYYLLVRGESTLQYTGSGNKILWYFVVPFLIFFYIIFLFWADSDFKYHNTASLVAEKKRVSLASIESVGGIILGGSNAFYGLRASTLSQFSELRWANLALPAEGYSDENYWNFISGSLSNEQRLEVSNVIYSSATPFSSRFRDSKSLDLGGKKKTFL